MKTFAAVILALVTMTIKTPAQIPNAGFENWTPINNCVGPTGWYDFYSLIDSTGIYCPVRRSNDHFPPNIGGYSVRISNDTSIWNTGILPGSLIGWGILLTSQLNDEPLFPITGHPASLWGYYKFFPEHGDTMNIRVHLYKNGVEVTSGKFQSDAMTVNWTPFQITVSDTLYNSADSARIVLSAANEPKSGSTGPLGNSVLFVDNLSFDNLITSVGDFPNELPGTFDLEQNYPNPFNPSTTIRYQLPTRTYVTLRIFDVLGREVTTLQNGVEEPGYKSLTFNASGLASGMYYYHLQAGNYIETRKLLLLK